MVDASRMLARPLLPGVPGARSRPPRAGLSCGRSPPRAAPPRPGRVVEVQVDAAAHERRQEQPEGPHRRGDSRRRGAGRRCSARWEAAEGAGEAPPDPGDGIGREVSEQAFGDDREAPLFVELGDHGGQAARSVSFSASTLANLVALGERSHPSSAGALARGHLREVGLDVAEPVAVAVGEPPASRRQTARDLDHLGDPPCSIARSSTASIARWRASR